MTRALLAVLVALVATVADGHQSDTDLERALSFEGSSGALPVGWGGGPRDTMAVVNDVVHNGEYAGRIERTADSPSGFTSFTYSMPLDAAGKTLELRGYLRTEGVVTGSALWLRQDSASGGVVAFDNMRDRAISGTTDWTEYTIQLPLERTARNAAFGFLLTGPGKVWGDDLRLLVDGRPVSEAPRRELTIFDTDREFDGGSGIVLTAIASTQVENLALLGKIWGFLKYHHPRVTAGNLHWDYELFRVLPRVLNAVDAGDARRVILEWARDRVGPAADCSPCATLQEDGLHLKPDVDWIHDRGFLGLELSQYLEHTYERRSIAREHFYLSLSPAQNAKFENESMYGAEAFSDVGFRVLTLFRIWNMVEYWFPYRDLLAGDWDDSLSDFLQPVVAAGGRDDLILALLPLYSRVADTHANLWNGVDARPPRGKCLIPLGLRFVEGSVVIALVPDWVPIDLSAVRVGDVVASVDGRRVGDLLAETAIYYPASNEATRRLHQARWLGRGPCEPASLTLDRGVGQIKVEIGRMPLGELDLTPVFRHDREGDAFQALSDEVGYLKMSAIEEGKSDEYLAAAAGMKGLVVDIRNYPSAFPVFELGGHLVAKPTAFARFTRPDPANPGAFRWDDPVILQPLAPLFEGRLAILVDESTLSSAEYHAMAFRAAPGAVVVGSTTSAADGDVSPMELPGGLMTGISGLGVFYPDKSPTQQIGIVPDVVVAPTIAGLREGRDEVLEEAIRQVLGSAVDERIVRRMASKRLQHDCTEGLIPRLACEPAKLAASAPPVEKADRLERACSEGTVPRNYCFGRWQATPERGLDELCAEGLLPAVRCEDRGTSTTVVP